jgi:hypothetical protein
VYFLGSEDMLTTEQTLVAATGAIIFLALFFCMFARTMLSS